jgi:centromere/kinetochore protein ZW10
LDQDIAAVKNKQGLEVSETPIQLAPCHISVKVQTLIELLYQKLISLAQDGQEKDSEIAIEVYFLARDTLDLFRALMMSQFSNISQPSFKDALVFYNDCQYICHHLITLSRQFQEVLPDPLRQSATFVDMTFLFRALGEEKLTALWVNA